MGGVGWSRRIPKPFRGNESRLSREEGIRLSPEASYYSLLDFIIVAAGRLPHVMINGVLS